MTEPYSESDTRQQLIDHQLRLAGWNIDDASQVIRELDIHVARARGQAVREPPRSYEGHRFADYALVVRGKPVAVIEATVLGTAWWTDVTPDKLRILANRLGPLMRFRQQARGAMVSLNLADIRTVHERIALGQDGRDMPVVAYRQRVEDTVRRLLAENVVLQRLQAGDDISDTDLAELAALLAAQDPGIDEARLRQVYDIRHAGLVKLLRHVLGVESLERWSTFVTREFDEFIAARTTLTALQIRFLQTLRTFLLQRGRVERRDLVESPFTRLHPDGIRGVFRPAELDEVIGLATRLVA